MPPSFVRLLGLTCALVLTGCTTAATKDLERLDRYIASTERMRALAAEQKIDVLLSNHAAYDQALDKLEQLRTQGSGAANPFVLGTAGVQRALTVMGECAHATRDRFAPMP